MKLIEKICFPTDFGKSSDVALESVIGIAKRFGSEVYLVHVLPESMQDKLQGFVDDKMKRYIGLLEEQQIKCSSDILLGNHIDMIISFAERKKTSLIVLGAGHTGNQSFKLGSNSLKIIRNSSIPVWVVEEDNAIQPENVLCPIDFSEESMLALDSAIHLCRKYGSKLHILHIVKGVDKEYAEFGVETSVEQAKIVKKKSLEFDALIKDLDFSGISWDKEVRYGDPVHEILNKIKDANIDLLMMGSSGKGALKRFFLGSVAERVSRRVPCSFIINKTEALIQLKLEVGILDIEDLYNEGVQLAKQGFIQEAIVEWKKCICKNELYFKAWSAMVKAYENLGDTESATKYRATRERIQRVLWDRQIEADLKRKQYGFK